MKDPCSRRAEKDGAEEKAAARDLGRDLGAMLVESTPDALIALAPDHTILFWSTGAETIFGYTREEALGGTLDELAVPPDLIEESRQATLEAIEVGLTVFESLRRRKDGTVINVDITSKAVRDEDGGLKFVRRQPEGRYPNQSPSGRQSS